MWLATANQSGSYIIWIYKNIQKYWMFALSTYLQTIHDKTYKELLGTCIKSKKAAYIYSLYQSSS